MTTYLLDTSAVMAHCRQEPGYAHVQAVFTDRTSAVLLAAPSLLEMETVLRRKVTDAKERRATLDAYGDRLATVVPVDRAAVFAAIALREAATQRIPALDALIAGCAAAHGAVLVHCDPHFDAIPASRLKTLRLPDTEEPLTSSDVPPMVNEAQTKYNVAKRRSKTRR